MEDIMCELGLGDFVNALEFLGIDFATFKQILVSKNPKQHRDLISQKIGLRSSDVLAIMDKVRVVVEQQEKLKTQGNFSRLKMS